MKQLENILNLAPEDDDPDEDQEDISEDIDIETARQDIQNYQEASGSVDKIDGALPPVSGLEDHDKEMDSLAEEARKAYDDLMNLGLNVDTKYSGRMFEVAASMLGHSIAAKNSKVDKKMKMIELQLRKQKQDQAESKGDPDTPADGEGEVIDRSQFLRDLLDKNKS